MLHIVRLVEHKDSIEDDLVPLVLLVSNDDGVAHEGIAERFKADQIPLKRLLWDDVGRNNLHLLLVNKVLRVLVLDFRPVLHVEIAKHQAFQ